MCKNVKSYKMNRIIFVISGKDKRRLQYRRNAYLGNLGIISSHLNYIGKSNIITQEEREQMEKCQKEIDKLNSLFRHNKGDVIKIQKFI